MERKSDPIPHPQQRRFLLLSDVQEILYGGAAAGGKSESLLMAAAQYVDVPGYSALLLRKSFPDLMQPNALVPRSKAWWYARRLPGCSAAADWNRQERRWTFPSGATITFGYLEHDDDVYQYQGAEYQFIGIDELTQHGEQPYRYLFSRLRKPAGPLAHVPLRMRSASNPGGKGHEWVKRRFVNQTTREPGVVFVPAKLHDNPSIDPIEYIQSLNKLLPTERAQLLQGDWDAFSGGRFRAEWFLGRDGQRGFWVETRRGHQFYRWTGQAPGGGIPVDLAWTFIICDPAARAEEANDHTAMVVFAVMPGGEVLILEVVREHLDIEAIAPRMAELCATWQPLWVGIEATGFQVAVLRSLQRHPAIPSVQGLEPEGKSKLVRATPSIIKASEGGIYLPMRGPLVPWVEEFVSECVQFTGTDEDSSDDMVDCLAYGVLALARHGLTAPTIITPEQAVEELARARGSGGGIFMQS